MRTRIQKWGNSLAVRIPKTFAVEAGLEQDTPIEVLLEDGNVVLRRVRRPSRYSLEELLSQVTDENRHEEVDFGPAMGKEAW